MEIEAGNESVGFFRVTPPFWARDFFASFVGCRFTDIELCSPGCVAAFFASVAKEGSWDERHQAHVKDNESRAKDASRKSEALAKLVERDK
jgi:hypothetical protein